MKAILLALLPIVAALAVPAPAPQQGDAWFPDVYMCRCHSAEQDLPVVQPICKQAGGSDMTLYPPAQPDPTLGRFIWCESISTKSAQRTNRLLPYFNDANCQKQFGADFKAECQLMGYSLCYGEEECW